MLKNHRTELEKGIAESKITVGAVLLDVRSAADYNEGHLPQSINIPLYEVYSIAMPKDTQLFVYCHDGSNSAKACGVLRRLGYKVKNIGGIYGYRGKLERGSNARG